MVNYCAANTLTLARAPGHLGLREARGKIVESDAERGGGARGFTQVICEAARERRERERERESTGEGGSVMKRVTSRLASICHPHTNLVIWSFGQKLLR